MLCLNEPEAMLVPVRLPNEKSEYVYAIVDAGDFHRVETYQWRQTSRGHIVASTQREIIYLHKLVAGGRATHINGDRLDNRQRNLRPLYLEKLSPVPEVEWQDFGPITA